ncbi:MAG TPA: hypothetical protein VIL77_05675 [Gaiellaceae bacterium]
MSSTSIPLSRARVKAGAIPWSEIRGFNYQPSYSSSDIESWQLFDPVTIDRELERGKRYFPNMNAIRIWHSWAAFSRGPEQYAEKFEQELAIADKHGLVCMPVLFNRWHDYGQDWGGIYFDHFLPGLSWVQSEGMWDRYLELIVGAHADDPRIFCWDLCNEPFSYTLPLEEVPQTIVDAEYEWLKAIRDGCKAFSPVAPIGISTHPNHGIAGERLVEPLCDILLIHTYSNEDGIVDQYVELAREVDKPILSTEACWGADEDDERVRIIEGSLSMLKERNIGWLVHILHHSLTSDAHRPEFGPVNRPGFHFIDEDGSLRPGHDVFNRY